MGTLTIDEMKTEIRANMGGRTDIDNRLYILMNLAQTRIARKGNFQDMKNTLSYSTVASTKTVAISTTIREILSLVIIDGTSSHKITQVSSRQFDSMVPYPEAYSTGKPTLFIIYNDLLEFWKVPDAIYTLRMRATIWPTAFILGDTVAKSTLDEKDDIIIALTTAMAFDSLRMQEDADKYFKIYATMMREAMDESEHEPGMDLAPDFELDSGRRSGDYYKDPFRDRMP